MKLAIALAALFAASVMAVPAFGQQMVCRPLDSGNVYVFPGEQIVQTETGREACRLTQTLEVKAPQEPQKQTHEDTRPRVYVNPIAPAGHGSESTASVESALAKKCGSMVTGNKDKADYVLDYAARGNEFTLFNRDGDLVLHGGKSIWFDKTIEKICKAIR